MMSATAEQFKGLDDYPKPAPSKDNGWLLCLDSLQAQMGAGPWIN
jgi:hypothetical protein